MSFKGHALVLYLSPELSLALAKTEADFELGRSYAGLLAICEGFHTLGHLSDPVYVRLKKRYSEKLIEEVKAEENPLDKTFKTMLNSWDELPPKTREWTIRKAQENPENPLAKKILEKISSSGN